MTVKAALLKGRLLSILPITRGGSGGNCHYRAVQIQQEKQPHKIGLIYKIYPTNKTPFIIVL